MVFCDILNPMSDMPTRCEQQRIAVVRQPPRYELANVQRSVNRAVETLGLTWRGIVHPGDRVLLKPNFIRESHAVRPDEWEQITTHGTVIAAVACEVAAAMDGRGTLTIA